MTTNRTQYQPLRLELRDVAALFKAPADPAKRLEAELCLPGIRWCSDAPEDILRAQMTLQSDKFLAVLANEARRATMKASMKGRALSEEAEALFSDAFIRINEQVCLSAGIPFPGSPDFRPEGLGGYMYIAIRNHVRAAMNRYSLSYAELSLDAQDDSNRPLHDRIAHEGTLPAGIESRMEREELLDRMSEILAEEDALKKAFLHSRSNRHTSPKHRVAYALVGAPQHMEPWLFDAAEDFGSRPLEGRKLEWLNNARTYLDGWTKEGVSKRRSRAFSTWLLHGEGHADAGAFARKEPRRFQRARDTLRKNVARGKADFYYGMVLLLASGRLRGSQIPAVSGYLLRQYLLRSAELWSGRADLSAGGIESMASAISAWMTEHGDALESIEALQELAAVLRSGHPSFAAWELENQRKARHNLTKVDKRLRFMKNLLPGDGGS